MSNPKQITWFFYSSEEENLFILVEAVWCVKPNSQQNFLNVNSPGLLICILGGTMCMKLKW